jgi:thiosulfate reductase cytochrome b subunit
VILFFTLLVSGVEILISHPRFYWGEVGSVMTTPMFTIPIPASRQAVPTGYGYVMPDQNGWSRSLHFQSAWALLLIGLVYAVASIWSGHFRRDLFPARGQRNGRAFRQALAKSLRLARPDPSEGWSYNPVQRIVYLAVIFLLFPLVIWTGLAMSPAFAGAFPVSVAALGGRQSARTIHFFVTDVLVLFLLVHVAMIILAGFKTRMIAMITGRIAPPPERP